MKDCIITITSRVELFLCQECLMTVLLSMKMENLQQKHIGSQKVVFVLPNRDEDKGSDPIPPTIALVKGPGIWQQKFPTIPVLALTTIATIIDKEDVVQAPGLVERIVFRKSLIVQI